MRMEGMVATEVVMVENNTKKHKNMKSKLDKKIFGLSPLPEDYLTIRQILNHVLIMGITGSSKSTSSGRKIFASFLKEGMGEIIMTAKSSDTKDYIKFIKALKENI